MYERHFRLLQLVLCCIIERTIFPTNFPVLCVVLPHHSARVLCFRIYISNCRCSAVQSGTCISTIHCPSQQQWSPGVHIEPWEAGYYLYSPMCCNHIYLNRVLENAKHCRSVYFLSLCISSHHHTDSQKHQHTGTNWGRQPFEKLSCTLLPYTLQRYLKLQQWYDLENTYFCTDLSRESFSLGFGPGFLKPVNIEPLVRLM